MKSRKILAGLLSAVLAVSASAIPLSGVYELPRSETAAAAYSLGSPCTDTSGTCGEKLTWELNSSGVLTISGKGEMKSFYDSTSPFCYREDIKSVVIKEGVTGVGYEAFSYCSSLTAVTLPNSLTSIEGYAFSDCSMLKNITIPEGVTSIGRRAFGSCISLTNITIPHSVTSIEAGAFLTCFSLKSITILNPKCELYNSNTTICSGIKDGEVYFDGTIYGYKDSFAQSCAEVWGYKFESLGEYAAPATQPATTVYASDDTTSGTCGDNVTWVLDTNGVLTISGSGNMYKYDTVNNKSPFYTREDIKSVVIEKGVTSIGGGIFSDSSIESVTLPDSVTSIGEEAFFHCRSLKNITIPNSVTSIGDGAFYQCNLLAEITIPSSVTSIGKAAFDSCYSLTSITVPASVTSICIETFAYCKELKSITILAPGCEIYDSSETICNGAVDFKPYFDGTIYGYKDSTAQSYAEKYGYSFESLGETPSGDVKESGTCGDNVTWVLDSKGVLTISGTGKMYDYQMDESPFAKRTDIKSLVIKNGVTSIGNQTFSSCTSLKDITIPDSVTKIGFAAFYGCKSLTNAALPDSITIIDSMAFEATSLKNITIPDSVKSIENYAFNNCALLKSITILNPQCMIYDSGKTISTNDSKFNGTIYGYENSTAQAYAEKYGCSFKAIEETPSGDVKESGTCGDNVTWVLDANDVLTLSGTGKMGTVSLKFLYGIEPVSIVIKDGITDIGAYVFQTFYSLKKVTIPDSVTSIGVQAFDSCYSLTSITIPDTITSIGENAFAACKELNSITILNPECVLYDRNTTICNGMNYEQGYFNGTIYGYSNSTAQAYAEKYKYKFESIGEYAPPATQPTTTPITTTTTKATTTTTKATTTTAKPSSTTTKTTTQPVVTNGFQWGRDNWNFNNNSQYFTRGTYFIHDSYLEKMRRHLTNKEWCAVNNMLGRRWGGSCHGMSATAFLAGEGLLTYGNYTAGSDCLYKVASPDNSIWVESLVNYYHLMQISDTIQQEYRKALSRTAQENLQLILSGLEKKGHVLVGYQQNAYSFGGHTVLAYGHESGLWKFDGVNYTDRINILDPNFSTEFNPESCIYYNPQTYGWAVPAYKVSSDNRAEFNLVVSDTDIVNYGGYLGEPQMNTFKDYISGLEIGVSSNINMSIAKVLYNGGAFINQATASGDIMPVSFCFSGGAMDSKAGYLLKDSEAGYRVTQDSYGKMDLKIDYADCVLSANSAHGKEITFDPSGYAGFVGSGSDYSFEMVYNEGCCPLDWYRIQVSGENADRVSLEKTEEGFVLTGSSLSGISVTADNDSHKAQRDFSADCKSVLIYEIDEDTVGIKADNDGDGTYESELGETSTDSGKTKVPEGIEPTSYGDTNLDGAVNIADVVQLNKFLLNKKDNPIEGPSLANADCMRDGYIDSSDSTLLMNYVSMQITEDKLGSK